MLGEKFVELKLSSHQRGTEIIADERIGNLSLSE
jgi:hypothetical protein